MATPTGKFGWYELLTTDTEAAGRFYSSVVGWVTHEMPSPTGSYTVYEINGVGIAGMMTTPPDAGGMPPNWTGYITVDDVDTFVGKIEAAGGKLCKGPMDVPGMLRFAVVSGPGGEALTVFTPDPAMPSPERPAPPAAGTIGWHELYAADLDSAWAFYSGLFGWKIETDMDMGPMGIYRIFTDGEKQIGGMMTKPPNVPAPFWAFYFHVDGINAAVERVKAGGGTVLMGPHQVPGNQWIIQGIDPQGANFALVSNTE
jgi:predicted enzyme related to lactoylglutathione lyase